jgi:hypothetical protein
MEDKNFTTKFDGDGEAPKWFSYQPEHATELWTVSEDGYDLGISLLPDHILENCNVPVLFRASSEGMHELSFGNLISFSSDVFIYLEDKITGIIHDPRLNGSYEFFASPEDPRSRFQLHFLNAPYIVREYIQPIDDILVQPSGSEILVRLRSNEMIRSIRIIDVSGRVLESQSGINRQEVRLNFKTGVFLVEVDTKNAILRKKVIF